MDKVILKMKEIIQDFKEVLEKVSAGKPFIHKGEKYNDFYDYINKNTWSYDEHPYYRAMDLVVNRKDPNMGFLFFSEIDKIEWYW
ncbi:MAG: hypothetical protein N3D17_07910, partial [bacterium]|nr:hypothetical protein [bacterium]